LSGPRENALAFGRKSDETMRALDDHHVEFLLEMSDCAGKRRLRNMTRLGRAAEVSFARECHEIFKLSDEHSVCTLAVAIAETQRVARVLVG